MSVFQEGCQIPMVQEQVGGFSGMKPMTTYVMVKVQVSIQGNSGPMVLHKCLALATCICSKSNWVCLLCTEFAKNPEKQTKLEGFPPVGGYPELTCSTCP